MIIDPEAAENVRQIFSLAEQGLGSVAIASTLEARGVLSPSAYKSQHGERKFAHYPAVKNGKPYSWCATTISQMFTGILVSLKTEAVNCKTKQRKAMEKERQIETPNAHEAIISQELFNRVHEIRATHRSPANTRRFNLFRGKLFCECCGHPLMISKKELLDRTTQIFCTPTRVGITGIGSMSRCCRTRVSDRV